LHIAHQQLISQANAIIVIERNSGYLTPGYKRTLFTTKPIYFYHFDSIKELSPKEFIDMLQNDFPNLQTIVVGYDFVFGKNKSGNTKILKKLFEHNVKIVDEIMLDGISVHSRVIKEYIKNGDIDMTNKLLGRKYLIDGDIIKGQGLGSKKLVSTLNLKVQDYQLPKEGVYATYTMIDNYRYNSVSFIGHRVTTDGSFAVETHLLDTTLPHPPITAKIEFVSFLRDNMKFNSLQELKAQIEIDIDKTKEVLKNAKR
jgi:riboflavin kinase/FMN adenylyltransferase